MDWFFGCFGDLLDDDGYSVGDVSGFFVFGGFDGFELELFEHSREFILELG